MGALTNLYSDFSNYFTNEDAAPEGVVTRIGNGNIVRKGGTATFTPDGGDPISFGRGTNPYSIAQKSPGLRSAWEETYGADVFSGGGTSQNDYIESIYGPKNPESVYSPGEKAVAEGISPRSGLPAKYQESLLSSIIPELIASAKSYKSDIDASTEAAQGMYKGITDQLSKEQLPQTLESLAGRNVLDSSVASDAIAKTQSNIANQTAILAYQGGMDAARLKAGYPALLSSIASLGTASTDELAPYQLLSDLILNA